MDPDRDRRRSRSGRDCLERVQDTSPEGLQDQFGSEYDRTVADAPNRREAESELSDRQKRREELEIRPLQEQSRDRYASEWHNTQARSSTTPRRRSARPTG